MDSNGYSISALAEPAAPGLDRLVQFYRAARKGSWTIADLSWDALPPVPRVDVERWRLLWTSVVEQQLQADRLAIAAATRLLLDVPESQATLYYATMVQDEARHVECWTRLCGLLEATDTHDPYLEEMGQMVLEGSTLEERVVAFQVLFEGTAIDAFKDIAASTPDTILGQMATRLIRDDSIHHNSGVAYAHYLLADASPALCRHVSDVLKRFVPLYEQHLFWRPPARSWLSPRMAEHDRRKLERNQVFTNRATAALGLKPPFDL